MHKNSPSLRRTANVIARIWLLAFAALCIAGWSAAPAAAETRSLKLYYVHTKERKEIVFKRNGRYTNLNEVNRFLRDWRRNEPTKIDPKLLDIVWEVYRKVGARDYIHVVSAYRSPATNAMLRRTRGGQAEKSQHMVGKALDFYIPGVKLATLRATAMKIQGGGVGYYPKSGSPFVHLDTGRVRAWPRMSRQELVRLFPDGKTLHLPADGKALPGYNQALAQYKQKGRVSTPLSGGNAVSSRDDEGGGRKKTTLLAALFGGGADEDEDNAEAATPATAAPKRGTEKVVAPAKPVKPAEALPGVEAAQPAARPKAPVKEPEPVVEQPAPVETVVASLPSARNAPVPTLSPRAARAAIEPPAPLVKPEDGSDAIATAIASADRSTGELKPTVDVKPDAKSQRDALLAAIESTNAGEATPSARPVEVASYKPPVPVSRPRQQAPVADLPGSVEEAPTDTFKVAFAPEPRDKPAASAIRAVISGEKTARPGVPAPVPAKTARAARKDSRAAQTASLQPSGKSAKPTANDVTGSVPNIQRVDPARFGSEATSSEPLADIVRMKAPQFSSKKLRAASAKGPASAFRKPTQEEFANRFVGRTDGVVKVDASN